MLLHVGRIPLSSPLVGGLSLGKGGLYVTNVQTIASRQKRLQRRIGGDC